VGSDLCGTRVCTDGAVSEGLPAKTEEDIERFEASEAEILEMRLLQTKVEKIDPAAEGRVASALELQRPRATSSVVASAVSAIMGSRAEGPTGDAAGPGSVARPLRANATAAHHEDASTELLEAAIPLTAILGGFLLVKATKFRTAGLLSIYFGVQTGLNIYMKVVLSGAVVSKEHHLKGIPAAFMITALQQLVSFALLLPGLALLWPTPWRYTPKPLTSRRAVFGVLGLSTTFALNIGLNNLCLSLLPMSINLMIRSCIPLATWLMQSLVAMCLPSWITADSSKSIELALMLLGVLFAGLASVAKEAGATKSEEASHLGIGLLVGVLSLVACSLYLIFAQWLGKDVKLNPLDMTLYMSVPAATFLAPLIYLMPHPVSWQGYDAMTDWEVLMEVLKYNPSAVRLAMLSGAFAVMYNTLQYAMVSELSATHTAFAGNFNKAATIVMSLALGMEVLPGHPWGEVTVFSIAGGIASFTAYSVVRAGAGGKGH